MSAGICKACYDEPDPGTTCPSCGKSKPENKIFPDPTPEMMARPEFEAIWQKIKNWDINVPGAYSGYCGATVNHVRAILDALDAIKSPSKQ